MSGILGIVVTFVMVFGGYLMAGGHMSVILHSLPFEMMMIGGAAVGAYVLSNNASTLRHTLGDIKRAFAGPRWTQDDHRDVLCLLYRLLRLARANPIELETHIEDPHNSAIFTAYPRILADEDTVGLIADTLRSTGLNYDDPYQVEDMLSRRIALIRDEGTHVMHALQSTADALPALGIVAAVLGVIKTMAAIDQPPEVLGKMIGGALVGTFLGVFLAYGLVGPLASRLANVRRQDDAFHEVIKSVLIAGLHQHATNLCVEVGRQAAPDALRPSYASLEASLRDLKKVA